nr:MAG TPA: HNH endonuclease [Caudoviricetes sp.]
MVPAALGGRNTLDNARVVCRECNQRRGSRAIPASAPTAPHTVGVLW